MAIPASLAPFGSGFSALAEPYNRLAKILGACKMEKIFLCHFRRKKKKPAPAIPPEPM